MDEFAARGRVCGPETLAFAVSATFTSLVAMIIAARAGVGSREFLYDVPIAFPFAAWIVDRILRPRSRLCGAIDAATVVLAVTRAFIAIPWISGHALFATYALVSSRLVTARASAAVVLGQVVVFKVVLFGDPATASGGFLLGLGLGLACCRSRPA